MTYTGFSGLFRLDLINKVAQLEQVKDPLYSNAMGSVNMLQSFLNGEIARIAHVVTESARAHNYYLPSRLAGTGNMIRLYTKS